MTNTVVTLSILVSLLAAALTPLVASQEALAEPDAVARFLARRDPPLTSYKALRRLTARNARFNVEGWLEAVTELSPDAGFTYRIENEGGSGYVRNRVLRAAPQGRAAGGRIPVPERSRR